MVEVHKKENETNISLLRRFSRKVRESSVLKRAKAAQFKNRKLSDFKKKQRALKRIKKLKEIEKLRKLGKID